MLATIVARLVVEIAREFGEKFGIERGIGALIFDGEEQLLAGAAAGADFRMDDPRDRVVSGQGPEGVEGGGEEFGTGFDQGGGVCRGFKAQSVAGDEIDARHLGLQDAGGRHGTPSLNRLYIILILSPSPGEARRSTLFFLARK